MIVGIHSQKIVYNSLNFMIDNSYYNELKQVFGKHLEEYFKNEEFKLEKNYKELCEAIQEHLNSFGWSDQEIIEEILKERKEKYILNYIEENHAQEDYFEIVELEDD